MGKGDYKQVVLETERLLLKELNPEIFYNLFNYYSENEIAQFLGLRSEQEMEVERRKFEEGYTTYNISYKAFLLVDKKTGKIIGKSGYHQWYLHHYRAEIGNVITDNQYLRKGYMKEANKAIIDYGFNTMGLNRIEAFVGLNNTASLSLLASLGFQKEGVLREHYFKNNRIEDSVCFGLLKRDWGK